MSCLGIVSKYFPYLCSSVWCSKSPHTRLVRAPSSLVVPTVLFERLRPREEAGIVGPANRWLPTLRHGVGDPAGQLNMPRVDRELRSRKSVLVPKLMRRPMCATDDTDATAR